MSVIAWDGRVVAADRRGCSGNMAQIVPKLYPVRGYAVGFVGQEDSGLMLIEWFDAGAKAEEWPKEVQESDDGSMFIIVGRKKLWEIGKYLVLSLCRDPFWAWGTGRETALGAMAMGADAEKAVEMAIRFDVNCGGGIDSYPCSELSDKDVVIKKGKKK